MLQCTHKKDTVTFVLWIFFFVVCATKFKTDPKRPERRQWRLCGVFIVDFDHISHLSSASITDLEKVNVSWIIPF